MTGPVAIEALVELERCLKLDAPNATDREWTELLAASEDTATALRELLAENVRSEGHRNDLMDKIVSQRTETGALTAQLAQARADLAAMIRTLEACRVQFDFYAQEHRKAEKHEKAATNERFAFMITQALLGGHKEQG